MPPPRQRERRKKARRAKLKARKRGGVKKVIPKGSHIYMSQRTVKRSKSTSPVCAVVVGRL
jgi:hypothetical protein